MESIPLDLLPGTALHEGFVEKAVCSDLPKGRLQMKQGVAVRQVTDALLAANPGCQREWKNGVVHLMPREAEPGFCVSGLRSV